MKPISSGRSLPSLPFWIMRRSADSAHCIKSFGKQAASPKPIE